MSFGFVYGPDALPCANQPAVVQTRGSYYCRIVTVAVAAIMGLAGVFGVLGIPIVGMLGSIGGCLAIALATLLAGAAACVKRSEMGITNLNDAAGPSMRSPEYERDREQILGTTKLENRMKDNYGTNAIELALNPSNPTRSLRLILQRDEQILVRTPAQVENYEQPDRELLAFRIRQIRANNRAHSGYQTGSLGDIIFRTQTLNQYPNLAYLAESSSS